MNSFPVKKRKLLFKVFIKLDERESLLSTKYDNAKVPDREVCIMGTLNSDYIYGIGVEVYQVIRDFENIRE